MSNAIDVRVTASGAKQAATDLNQVQGSLKGIGTSANGLGNVQGQLFEMSRASRMLNREFRGVSTFAGALDTIAGTNLQGTINDIKTVAEVADPLKNLAKDIEGKVGEYWAKFTGASLPEAAAAGVASGEAEGAAQGEASAAASLEGQGAKDAEKIAAAAATGEAEGVAEGEAMGGTSAEAAAAGSGKSLAGSLAGALGPALAVAGGAAVAVAFDQIAQQADAKVQGMGTEQAKTYSDSFASNVLGTEYQTLVANHLEDLFGPGFANMLGDLSKKAAEGAGAKAGQAFNDSLMPQFAHTAQEAAGTWGDIWPAAAQAAVGAFSKQLPQFVHEAQMSAEDAAKALSDKKIWDDSARSIDHDLATTLQGNTNVIDDAMKKVIYAIQNPLQDEADAAKLEGAITMLQYRRGLAGNSNEMNNVLDQQIAALEHQWSLIEGKAYTAGAYTATHWKNGYVTQWHGNNVNIPGYQGGGVDPLPVPHHHAMGGHMAANEPGIIGENGAELWIPDAPGTVVPKAKAQAASNAAWHGNGGGTTNFYFTINGLYGGPSGLDSLQRELDKRLRQTTRGAMRQSLVTG
jgi:hypothetical protein